LIISASKFVGIHLLLAKYDFILDTKNVYHHVAYFGYFDRNLRNCGKVID